MNNNETFEFTYSAKQQEEIEKIRRKYVTTEEDKMALLRNLDKNVTRPGTIVSIVIGLIGCLLLGIGMCCTMVWSGQFVFILGVVVGIAGIVAIGLAYPAYYRITAKERKKVAPQILSLIEELSK